LEETALIQHDDAIILSGLSSQGASRCHKRTSYSSFTTSCRHIRWGEWKSQNANSSWSFI